MDACIVLSDQPRRSGSFGGSPRDSSSILSPIGSAASMGSASGWGGSAIGSATSSSHETLQPSPVPTASGSQKSPKVRLSLTLISTREAVTADCPLLCDVVLFIFVDLELGHQG